MSFTSKEVGLTDFPAQDRPPVAIPFFAFRIMVGCGLLMLFLAWYGSYLERQGTHRPQPLAAVGDLPRLPAAVHRDPDRLVHRRGRTAAVDVYGVLRTADAMTPFLTVRGDDLARRVLRGLQLHLRVRHLYIYRLLRTGPAGTLIQPPTAAVPNRPMSVVDPPRAPTAHHLAAGEIAMIMFWVAVLAISILLYVLLDGFDLGVGMLFGLARDETRRRAMLSAVSPIWDGNETWLVVTGVILWGAFPVVYATLLSAFYLPLLVMLAGLILRGVAFEFRHQAERTRWVWDIAFAGGSLAATFIQGMTVGALVEGLPITMAIMPAAISAG
jgi:hypothetical protein